MEPTASNGLVLSEAERDLLVEALDSHTYWQLSEEQYRDSGFVREPGSDDPEAAEAIEACGRLADKLQAAPVDCCEPDPRRAPAGSLRPATTQEGAAEAARAAIERRHPAGSLDPPPGRTQLSPEAVAAARRAVAEEGAGHECVEWRDARGVCALCDSIETPTEAIARELMTARGMELHLRPVSAFQLAAVLQLAQRHPGVPDRLRVTIDTFLRGVREQFAGCPAILAALEAGDRPEADV